MQNQGESRACLSATRPGVMGDSDTQSALLMFDLLRELFDCCTAENLASQRENLGNGSKLFSAFVAILGYSTLTVIQNAWRSEIVSNVSLRPPSFSISSGHASNGERL